MRATEMTRKSTYSPKRITLSPRHALPRPHHVSSTSRALQAGLLGPWIALLMALSGQDDLVVGQPYSVQEGHATLQGVVGCFAFPLPVRIAASPCSTSFRQLLHKVYTELLVAIDHANLPLYRIIQAAGASGSAHGLFQTILQLLPLVEPLDGVSDLSGEAAPHLMGIDLFVGLIEKHDGAFEGTLTFNKSLFDSSTVDLLIHKWALLLRQVVDAADETLDTLTVSLQSIEQAEHVERRGSGRSVMLTGQNGEKISLFEVEEAVQHHPAVLDVLAFTVPHPAGGIAIGVAVVLLPGHAVSLRELNAAATAHLLLTRWLPKMLVQVDAVPTDLGGNPVRHGLAARLELHEPLGESGTGESGTVQGDLGSRLAGAELLATVLDVVRHITRNGQVTANMPLMDAGLNSMSATQVAAQLEQRTGIPLPPMLIFQFSTANAIASHLHSKLAPHEQQPSACTHSVLECRRDVRHNVRITGTAASWPVGASSDRTLARLAESSYDTVREVPGSRWLLAEDCSSSSALRYMSWLPNAELFDELMFAVSLEEALWMDPQQRLLLEKGYAALHDAGHTRGSLLAHDVAVTVAIQANDFSHIKVGSAVGPLSVYAVSGATFSVAAGRLSYVLGLQGACYNTDTACSAALVAAHSAATMVRDVECESALTIAVNLMLLPFVHGLLARAGMLSSDGRCKFLDARANGYVRSEGIGGALLALECKEGSDTQCAVSMCGSAVRSDGKSASLTAPNGQAQVRLLRAAMLTGGVEVRDVQATECHGTGTALGDPIETAALREVVLDLRGAEEQIVMGSVKANVGHMEPLAGMIGLQKLEVMLRRATAAPNAQLRVLNPHVSGVLRPCPACVLPLQVSSLMYLLELVGGVSSFGYSGTIAHVVLRHARSRGASHGPTAAFAHIPMKRRCFAWRDDVHPLLQRRVSPLATPTSTTFRSPFAGSLRSLFLDHQLQGRPFMSFTAYLETMRAACSGLAAVAGGVVMLGVVYLAPLVLEETKETRWMECRLHTNGNAEVRSLQAKLAVDAVEEAEVTVHCSGKAEAASSEARPAVAWAALSRRCNHIVDVAAFYIGDASGLKVGPAWMTLAWVRYADGGEPQAVGRLLPRSHWQGTRVHPADADAGLCFFFLINEGQQDPLPVDTGGLPRERHLLEPATSGAEPNAPADLTHALLSWAAFPVSVEEALVLSERPTLPKGDGSLVTLTVDDTARVATLELNDPQHFNALSSAMADDMQQAVQWLRTQPASAVKSLVLQGRGEHFCPGGNPYRMQPRVADDSNLTAQARFRLDVFAGFVALRTLLVPVVSAVHGAVLGGGLAIALHTDCIVASADATFQYGELPRGLTPAALFTQSLAEVVGHVTAIALYLSDSKLTTAKANAIGLVQHVCDTPSEAQQLAWRLAAAATCALPAGMRSLAPHERSTLAKEAFAQAESIRALKAQHEAKAAQPPSLLAWNDMAPLGAHSVFDAATGVAGAWLAGVHDARAAADELSSASTASSRLRVVVVRSDSWVGLSEGSADVAAALELLCGLGVPLVSALHGQVSGTGLQLAMGTDYRVADSQTTSFVHCGLVDAKLVWLLGVHAAGKFRAAETAGPDLAEQLNLAHERLDSDDVLPRALSFAAWLAAQPPVGLAGTLRLMRLPLTSTWPAPLTSRLELRGALLAVPVVDGVEEARVSRRVTYTLSKVAMANSVKLERTRAGGTAALLSVLRQLLRAAPAPPQLAAAVGRGPPRALSSPQVEVAPLATEFAHAMARQAAHTPMDALMAAWEHLRREDTHIPSDTEAAHAVSVPVSDVAAVEASPSSLLLLLRRSDASMSTFQPPLVISHSLFGDHRGYGRFWGAAVKQCDIYALQHRGLVGYEPFSLDADGAAKMAWEYGATLVSEFESHPFDMIGASFGAVLAVHVAQAAREQGGSPRRVVLIDPPPLVPLGLRVPTMLTDIRLAAMGVLLIYLKTEMGASIWTRFPQLRTLPEEALPHFVAAQCLPREGSRDDLIALVARFQKDAAGVPSVPPRLPSSCHQHSLLVSSEEGGQAPSVLMALSTERWPTWPEMFPGITEDALDQYGPAARLVLSGAHLHVVNRCLGNQDTSFTCAVDGFLSEWWCDVWPHLSSTKQTSTAQTGRSRLPLAIGEAMLRGTAVSKLQLVRR